MRGYIQECSLRPVSESLSASINFAGVSSLWVGEAISRRSDCPYSERTLGRNSFQEGPRGIRNERSASPLASLHSSHPPALSPPATFRAFFLPFSLDALLSPLGFFLLDCLP